MMKCYIVGATLLSLSTSAMAQSSYDASGRNRLAAWPTQQAWSAPSQHIYQSGNSCSPDRAEPVWGPGNAMMGYSCVPESANGS